MSLDADTLYKLLPAVHRLRDTAEGEPLRALISLIGREIAALEENLEQLYDDQFIETCSEWVAPYIGELIGYRPLHGVAARVSSPRAEVANTIAYRRRKGTALMLEQLAHDVTDWPARAVEFFEQLCTTQYMKHLRPAALATAALRSQRLMRTVDGPFNAVAHTAEVRRPEAGSGRYNIPNVGIFLWRLEAFRRSGIPLVADPLDTSGRRFRVNPLGADTPLFRRLRTEESIEHLAQPANVPAPLTVREFAAQVRDATAVDEVVATSDDYGAGNSVVISRKSGGIPLTAVLPPATDIKVVLRIADLRDVFDSANNFTGWAHEHALEDHQVALDPRLGRVLLGADLAAEHAATPLTATFHQGFSRPLGGGEYERVPLDVKDPTLPQEIVSGAADLQPHLDIVAPGGRLTIGDSLTYLETPKFRVDGIAPGDDTGVTVVVAAANGARPLISAAGNLDLEIGARGTLILDGLVIQGGALRLAAAVDNETRSLVLRDCTLVPGITLNPNGDPGTPGAASLIIEHPFTKVTLERCIVGSLRTLAESGVTIELRDCIVDAGAPGASGYSGLAVDEPGADLTLRESTVIGEIHARIVQLASNSILLGTVRVERRQEGCMRFCYAPADSITPRRFRCLPDATHPDARPFFTSRRYADPGYCQLRGATDRAIREGADDGGEIGVMHALFQPQRETNLRIRLDEYLRFGLHAGLFYAT